MRTALLGVLAVVIFIGGMVALFFWTEEKS